MSMTPEEFKEKMEKICADEDIRMRHVCADGLMCKLLEELGYKEGLKPYRDMLKWYA